MLDLEAWRAILPADKWGDSLVGDIALQIGRKIIEGEYEPGADLNTVELSKRFATSRTPVREALLLLEKEGLVEIPPRRRPVVRQLSADEIRELYAVRGFLLEEVMKAFVDAAQNDHLSTLRILFARLEQAAEAQDASGYLLASHQMQDFIVRHCGNKILAEQVDGLRLRTMPFRRLLLRAPDQMWRSRDKYGFLVLACEERDARLASAIIGNIMSGALLAVVAMTSAAARRSEEPPT